MHPDPWRLASLWMGPQPGGRVLKMHRLPFTSKDVGIDVSILEKGGIHTPTQGTCNLAFCSWPQRYQVGDSADTNLVSRSPLSVLTVSSVLRDRKGVTEVTTAGGQAGH